VFYLLSREYEPNHSPVYAYALSIFLVALSIYQL
jgi:hypothetical protein